MRAEVIVRTTQEQAVAAWIGLINQLRLDSLMEKLAKQDENLESAMASMDWALDEIENLVVNNRGGRKGVHGFIAEVAECGLENAESFLRGEKPSVEWVNDNGLADLIRDGVDIQVKFVNAGGKFSLEAVNEHLKKYPDFLDNDGVYQIPKDHLEAVRTLYSMPQGEASKLVAAEDGFSYRNWKAVHEFFDTSEVDIEDLESSKFEYSEVQKGAIEGKMAEEKQRLAAENSQIRKDIYDAHKPSLREGAKAAAVGAALEATTSFTLSVKRHVGPGKRLADLKQEDWVEIAKDSGLGLIKGGTRGAVVYGLNNFTAAPASVASALATASFGVADCAYKFRNGNLSELEFIEQSEIVCLDASASAFASLIGQVAIPVPVLGALIGNAVGTTMYELGKDFYSKREAETLEQYEQEIKELDAQLDEEYAAYIEKLREGMAAYIRLLDKAFSPDVTIAFRGSIELASSLGVRDEEILHSRQEIDDFFLA